MAKLQYGLNEEMLKNTIVANKGKIRIKIKISNVNKEPAKVEDEYEAEM